MIKYLLLAWLTFPWYGIASAQQVTASGAEHNTTRIALVIGNADYRGAPLKNPVNDARAIAAKLASLGFDVIKLENAGHREMNRAITRLGEKLAGGGVGLFYYAGHGMQVRGRNYLIPVDAEINTEASIRNESVDVDQILEQLASSPLNIVILDACRNNPFERRFRGASGGLAQVDAPMGTVIAYATAPGKVAADGDGENGLYTKELLSAIDTPGLRIEDVFKRVRVNVAKLTGNAQLPWEASSLTGDFFFKANASKAEPSDLVAIEQQSPTRGSYEGTYLGKEGIWSVVVTIKGSAMVGTMQCFAAKRNEWSGVVHFAMDIADDGNFSGQMESKKGWAARRVYGRFPEMQIEALNLGTSLDCPNGKVVVSTQ